jgi:hypothetical protein
MPKAGWPVWEGLAFHVHMFQLCAVGRIECAGSGSGADGQPEGRAKGIRAGQSTRSGIEPVRRTSEPGALTALNRIKERYAFGSLRSLTCSKTWAAVIGSTPSTRTSTYSDRFCPAISSSTASDYSRMKSSRVIWPVSLRLSPHKSPSPSGDCNAGRADHMRSAPGATPQS